MKSLQDAGCPLSLLMGLRPDMARKCWCLPSPWNVFPRGSHHHQWPLNAVPISSRTGPGSQSHPQRRKLGPGQARRPAEPHTCWGQTRHVASLLCPQPGLWSVPSPPECVAKWWPHSYLRPWASLAPPSMTLADCLPLCRHTHRVRDRACRWQAPHQCSSLSLSPPFPFSSYFCSYFSP